MPFNNSQYRIWKNISKHCESPILKIIETSEPKDHQPASNLTIPLKIYKFTSAIKNLWKGCFGKSYKFIQ